MGALTNSRRPFCTGGLWEVLELELREWLKGGHQSPGADVDTLCGERWALAEARYDEWSYGPRNRMRTRVGDGTSVWANFFSPNVSARDR